MENAESFNFEYFVEQVNNKNTINLVYEDNKEIVGFILAQYKKPSKVPFIRKRKVIFIDSIVVDENHKKMGIGRRMMEYLENIAKKKKVESVELNVYSFNKDAQKFYKALGMSEKCSIYEKQIKTK
jgi:ribosomal protein S18 acetylase RimI-like enzyme